MNVNNFTFLKYNNSELKKKRIKQFIRSYTFFANLKCFSAISSIQYQASGNFGKLIGFKRISIPFWKHFSKLLKKKSRSLFSSSMSMLISVNFLVQPEIIFVF